MQEIGFLEPSRSIVLEEKTFFMAFALLIWGYFLTPISIKLSGRFGILDQPSPRKGHSQPVPRGAGLVVWMGYLFWSLLFAPDGWHFSSLATGASMVFFIGYLDDMSPIKPIIRLIIHLIASSFVVIPLHMNSPLFYVVYTVWIAGCTNAYNLIDGMNGLSLSMAILSLLAIGLIPEGNYITFPLIAMCLGILPWNFPNARTFLGDGGVYLLGYVVATMTMWMVEPKLTGLGLRTISTLVLLGGVPVVDTLTTIVRRLMSGRSPFSPDRGHIHHRLLDKGLSQGMVLALLVFAQVLLLGAGFFISLSS